MSLTLALAVGSAVATSSFGGALDGSRAPVALSVSPARIALVAPASRTIELRNLGAERVVIDVTRKSVNPHVATKTWLSIRPARLVLRNGSRAILTLRARAQTIQAGDHRLMVLLIARPLRRGRVAVRVRLGVGVRIRIPGRIIRHLDVAGLRVRRRAAAHALLVSVVNHGNVVEQLRSRVTVTLVSGGRIVSRLRSRQIRELFPGARTVFAMPYAGGVRGVVTAVVTLRLEGLRPVVRSYRLRL